MAKQLYCHDQRHEIPCPLPCDACEDECGFDNVRDHTPYTIAVQDPGKWTEGHEVAPMQCMVAQCERMAGLMKRSFYIVRTDAGLLVLTSWPIAPFGDKVIHSCEWEGDDA